jgi:tryptophan synthase alpha chain
MRLQNQANRVDAKFCELSANGEAALVCYIMAGYPDLKSTESIIASLVAGGADIIEVGIPFSDPIADGPTMQQASFYALENGMTPRKALKAIQRVRGRFPDLPILAMTYSNILFKTGIENFLNEAQRAGLDGMILPDMPVEESESYVNAARKLNLCTVFLASPNTPEPRLRSVVEASSGFVYLVSVYGTTGARSKVEDYTADAIKKVKYAAYFAQKPVAVGFGISTPAHVKFMIDAGADGIIVGSAIIDRIQENLGNKKRMLSELESFARSMKKACKA